MFGCALLLQRWNPGFLGDCHRRHLPVPRSVTKTPPRSTEESLECKPGSEQPSVTFILKVSTAGSLGWFSDTETSPTLAVKDSRPVYLRSIVLWDARTFHNLQFLFSGVSFWTGRGPVPYLSGLREKPSVFIGIPVEVLLEFLVFP